MFLLMEYRGWMSRFCISNISENIFFLELSASNCLTDLLQHKQTADGHLSPQSFLWLVHLLCVMLHYIRFFNTLTAAFQLLFSAEEDSQETHQSFGVERAAHEDACAKGDSTYAAACHKCRRRVRLQAAETNGIPVGAVRKWRQGNHYSTV